MSVIEYFQTISKIYKRNHISTSYSFFLGILGLIVYWGRPSDHRSEGFFLIIDAFPISYVNPIPVLPLRGGI